MVIKNLSILNYKNIAQADLAFSDKINCFIGANGMGKTNVLDAVYYLSFCKSHTNPIDAQVVRHGEEMFMLQGRYLTDDGETETISCGTKVGRRKTFKRNGKDYRRLTEHIGFAPLVMISPADTSLITGGSEERRRFVDTVISQYDANYLDALVRYGRALAQRNNLLKAENEPDPDMMEIYEEEMAASGTYIYKERVEFAKRLTPVFQTMYSRIAHADEEVRLTYTSHCERGPLLDQLRQARSKERIVGFTLHGIHKDDLIMELGGFPIKKEGSQGQCKTYLVAMKLAQFALLKETGRRQTPLLLLDDVFDKLDSHRVEQIVRLAGGNEFGQIFLTDTNRGHLDRILQQAACDFKLFTVENGTINDETV